MRIEQKMAAGGLGVGLAAAGYGIFVLGRPSAVSAKKKAAAAEVALVDQTPVKTAQQLAQSADTPEEQKLARKALQLSDWELDLSFNIALQDAEAHPPELSAEAKEMQARLRKAQNLQQALQAQVDQLSAEIAKISASRKDALQDQLDLARASLDVATNDVDDAKSDLSDAGGDVHGRIEKMKEQHEAADKAQANDGTKFPAAAPEQLGVVHRVQQWLALHSKKNLLLAGKADADSLAASLAEQHHALSAQVDAEKFNSPDLAAHSKLADAANGASSGQSAAATVTENVRKTRSAADSKAALAITKAITADQRNLTNLDKRIDNEKELSQTYGEWIDLVGERQRPVLQRMLIGIVIVLGIALVGLFFNTWLEKLLGKTHLDQRQVQTLKATARLTVQVVAVLLILLVIFGPPSQLGTFLGLAGAGLTVALKDFIVGFLGWFVLMRKNGIRLGDWVEINGVTGEVIEIGLFHTVLLETGNWTDSGHPTGRRVTFTNSYAIEGHYFNFSTSGQWLWDELQVVLPTGQDPYPVIDAIQKKVAEVTSESAKQAEQEWQHAARSRQMNALSAAPAINVKPIIGGVEIAVRYLTQANERYQLRAKLYQVAVDLLGGKNVRLPSPPDPAAPAPASGG